MTANSVGTTTVLNTLPDPWPADCQASSPAYLTLGLRIVEVVTTYLGIIESLGLRGIAMQWQCVSEFTSRF